MRFDKRVLRLEANEVQARATRPCGECGGRRRTGPMVISTVFADDPACATLPEVCTSCGRRLVIKINFDQAG